MSLEDTFDDRAPISLGHYAVRQDWMPSWGNVENLMLESTGEGEATLSDLGNATTRLH